MAFEDIVSNLGQIATGWTVGTLEREQADRAESRQLIDTAVQRGAQGIDVAPFYTADEFRPANADVLQRLQAASGVVGPTTPPDAPMLQRPHARALALQAERDDAARTQQEIMYQAHAQDAETRQMRMFQQQQDLLTQRQTAPLRRTELNSAQWHDVRSQIYTAVDDGLTQLDPNYVTAGPRGPTITDRFQTARSQIAYAVEQRLPEHLPQDPVARGDMIRQIYNDVARGVTHTAGGVFPWSANSSITYNEQNALPRRQYGTGQGTAAPNGTAAPVNPGPGALTDRILSQHGQYIRPASRESGVPPQVIAAVIAPESAGRPGAVSPVSSASGQAAFGLMQIEPGTYAQIARQIGETGDIRDPRANVRVGTAYLAQLLRQYNGNYTLALAAYNWGPAKVDRILTQVPAGAPRAELLARMPPSTQRYLATIGNSMGGWDAGGQSFIGLTGQQPATADTPPGAATRNVAQTSPSPQETGAMETLLNEMERTARMYTHSVTDYTQRRAAKEDAIARAEALLRRNYPHLVEWAIGNLRTRLNDVR